MVDKRIDMVCRKCSHRWLIEPVKVEFKGSEKELNQWQREHGRAWNHCYCGISLYPEKRYNVETKKVEG